MEFRIHRFVLAKFDSDIDASPEWVDERSRIVVRSQRVAFNGVRHPGWTLFDATCIVSTLSEQGGTIEIPKELRRELESSIERLVDIFSILMMSSRHLSSPAPYIAIEGLNEESKSWLVKKRIRVSLNHSRWRMSHDMNLQSAMPLLQDRPDGAALLAEALASNHPSGKLREFFRLFERAFGMAAGKVCRNQLPRFLATSRFDIRKDEVLHWLELRDSTAHADRNAKFALQSETYPVVYRIEQAAFDVLFNKKDWHNCSTERREAFEPTSGPSDPKCGLFVMQGKEPKVSMDVFDGFAAYPLNLKASMTHFPSTWLIDFVDDSTSSNADSIDK